MVEWGEDAFGFIWEMPVDPSQPTLTPRPTLPLLTTFTPTPTATPTATYTPWYIFTPTPAVATQGPTSTPGELRINGGSSIGPDQAFVQITSSNPDAILLQGSPLTKGSLSFEGYADLRGSISMVVKSGENGSGPSWEFQFYAPDMKVGPTYRTDEGPAFNQASITSVFVRPSGVDMTACPSATGEFRIESLEPHLVISFTHACNGDPSQEIRGLIVFRPTN